MSSDGYQRDAAIEWLRDIFDADVTRLLLSVLIILSVLPFPQLDRYAFFFFGIFAIEWMLRLAILRHELRHRSWSRVEIVLLFFDLLATLSFLPLQALFGSRFLRLLRLSRMVMLLSYWRAVVKEIWIILLKRERRYQLIFVGSLVVIVTFVSAILLSYFSQQGIDFNEDGNPHNETFFTALWWSFRQLQDPGNLVKNPTMSLAFFFSLGLTVAGVFIIAFVIGIGASIVEELVHLGRERRLGMRNHSVIGNLGPHSRQLVEELVSYYAKSFRSARIATMGAAAQRYSFMYQDRLRRIRYRQGKPLSAHDLSRVDADRARRVILLGKQSDPSSDSEVVSQILSVREANPKCWIYAELFRGDNVGAALGAGGGQTVPVLAYRFVALLLADLLAFPDLEAIYKQLLSSDGNEIYTAVFGHGQLEHRSPPTARIPPFGELMERSHHVRDVVLLGYLVDDPARPEGFRHVLNPGAADNAEWPAVPDVSTLRGFFGLATNFEQLKSLVEDLSDVAGAEPPPRGGRVPRFSLRTTARVVDRLLICGFHEGIVDFCRQVVQFFPGVKIYLMVPTRALSRQVLDTFAARSGEADGDALGHDKTPRIGFVVDREGGSDGGGRVVCQQLLEEQRAVERPRGRQLGRVEVMVGDWSHLNTMQAQPEHEYVLREMDAVLLTYTDGEQDADARTALGLFKLVQLETSDPDMLPDDLHVLCEVQSSEKAQLLERRFRQRREPRPGGSVTWTTIIAAEHMRNAFLAQGVFVPGISSIYSELLCNPGYELCQLEVHAVDAEALAASNEDLDFGQLLAELYQRERLILIAVELEDDDGHRQVVVNPPVRSHEYRFPAAALRSVFAVGDIELLSTRGALPIGRALEPDDEDSDDDGDEDDDDEGDEGAALDEREEAR
ncbi:MAG: hypothetical protein KC503_19855 [Myxococcales bacterium]|nr:hypothetical protein [Myxococcales bacterium]